MTQQEYEYDYEVDEITQEKIVTSSFDDAKQLSKIVTQEQEELNRRENIINDIFLRRDRAMINNNNISADVHDRAMINNNNNNNNTINNIITFNDDADEVSDNHQHLDSVTPWQATPSEDNVSSQEAERGNVTAEAAPWKYIKLDLFDNAKPEETVKGIRKLKIKISYLLPGKSKYKNASASMGGRFRDIKKGMDMDNADDRKHYDLIESIYHEFSNAFENVSASKCYESVGRGKGNSIIGLSVVIGQMAESSEYAIAVIYEGNYQLITVDGAHITKLQRDKNLIASGHWGTSQTKRLTFSDFNGE